MALLLRPCPAAAAERGGSRRQQQRHCANTPSLLCPRRNAAGHRRRAAIAAAAPDLPDPVAATQAAYVGLGAAAVSFAATFGVAPHFKNLLKEPVDWREVYAYLMERGGVKTVSPQEAQARARKG